MNLSLKCLTILRSRDRVQSRGVVSHGFRTLWIHFMPLS